MGKGIVVVGVLGALASTAFAEDEIVKIADGYELVSSQRGIDIRKGKRRATLFVGYSFDLKAKVDAKAKKVTISRHEECRSDLSETLTFDQLEARLLNTESLVLHRKKDWANTAKGFGQAAKLDPAYTLAAYNLASAHARLGQLTEANAALAPWLKSNPIATYIQVSVDSELQPLLATKEVLAVKGTTKPGTVKVAESGEIDGGYAYSAERGWLAVPHSAAGYLDCNANESLTIFDVKTGKQVGSIPLGCASARSRSMTTASPDRDAVFVSGPPSGSTVPTARPKGRVPESIETKTESEQSRGVDRFDLCSVPSLSTSTRHC